MTGRGLLIIAMLLSLVVCGDTTDDVSDDELYEFVSDGKLDDYRSTTGQEYLLMALDSITLSDDDMPLEGEAREARAEELVSLRFKAISFFLYAYLAAKSHDDDNADYGGFRTTVRQLTFESMGIDELEEQPGTYDFIFEAEAAGPPSLLEQIPLNPDYTFALIIPILSNDELESGSYTSTYSHFNPEDHSEENLRSLMIEISPQTSEPDAYPEYQRLFEDGMLDIAIHVGGDYNDSRYDLRTARDLFSRLQYDQGFVAPVRSYEELRSDSGPFVGELDANGTSIDIEVYLYHPDMYQEEGMGYDGLLELYRQSAAARDIVIYDGHAGYNTSYSGVVVHYNPRHAIPADDFTALDLPERYQLFVFNGCKTYTSYADAMYAHSNKDSSNLDIISTVNFSWLSDMTRVTSDMLGALLRTNGDGEHLPMSYDHLLSELNSGRSWDVIYGVHGLSDNPRLSPYADTDSLCQSCGDNSECPGADSLCLLLERDEARACTAACTDDTGCPEGYACESVARVGTDLVSASHCVPTSGSCQQ